MAVKNKSYLNNPALQFISSALVDEATAAEPAPAPAPSVQPPKAKDSAPKGETSRNQAAKGGKTPKAKPQAMAEEFEVPMKPLYVEVRSKRFNALLQPSLYRNLCRLAERENISVNELMHRILEAYVRDNAGA